MSSYFIDTSALIKRYVPEVGSAWMKSVVNASLRHNIVISRLTIVEFNSALTRRFRDRSIRHSALKSLEQKFAYDVRNQYILINLTNDVLENARQLVLKHPLRALDSIQLASALKAQQRLSTPLAFVSADVRLLTAAANEGLATDDPNAHP